MIVNELEHIRQDPKGFFKRLRGWQNGPSTPTADTQPMSALMVVLFANTATSTSH